MIVGFLDMVVFLIMVVEIYSEMIRFIVVIVFIV